MISDLQLSSNDIKSSILIKMSQELSSLEVKQITFNDNKNTILEQSTVFEINGVNELILGYITTPGSSKAC